jgi:5,10-methylene-tetrahydrofolate dehydrogenase/methenyl tetrahydrofolate cyclohydrolase
LTSSDWFWETDEHHILTYVSEGIRAFGQDPQARISRSRLEIAAAADRDQQKWQAHIAQLNRYERFRGIMAQIPIFENFFPPRQRREIKDRFIGFFALGGNASS